MYYTVCQGKNSTKFITARGEKGNTLPDPKYKVEVTLSKLISWPLFTGSYLSLDSHLQENIIIIAHSAVQQPSKSSSEQQNPSLYCHQKHNRASVESSLCSLLFMATQQSTIPKQLPEMTFSSQKPCLALVWGLAHSCCNCRVSSSCSSYLPFKSISQTHL